MSDNKALRSIGRAIVGADNINDLRAAGLDAIGLVSDPVLSVRRILRTQTVIRRGRAPRRSPMHADRVTVPSVRRVVRSQAAAERLREWIGRDIGAWLHDNVFDLNTDCGGRWFPQLEEEYITASRFTSRLHGMWCIEAAETWPVTREGLRSAIAWCEAANATMPPRHAVML